MNRDRNKEAFEDAMDEQTENKTERPVWSPQASEFLDQFHKGEEAGSSGAETDGNGDGDGPDAGGSLTDRVIDALRQVYDPEIPVNIYDLGLIYGVEAEDNGDVVVTMTLTTPHCPVAETMPGEVEARVAAVEGVRDATVDLVWDPPWDMTKMTDEARLELGLL